MNVHNALLLLMAVPFAGTHNGNNNKSVTPLTLGSNKEEKTGGEVEGKGGKTTRDSPRIKMSMAKSLRNTGDLETTSSSPIKGWNSREKNRK